MFVLLLSGKGSQSCLEKGRDPRLLAAGSTPLPFLILSTAFHPQPRVVAFPWDFIDIFFLHQQGFFKTLITLLYTRQQIQGLV